MALGQGRRPVRILIADDDFLFARMARTQLSAHAAFEVVGIAENGEEAIDLADDLEPDLVLMDVSMPVLDGIEATSVIRAHSDPPTVVLITGEDDMSDARAYAAGAAAYLRKSADVFALIDVILAVSKLAAPFP